MSKRIPNTGKGILDAPYIDVQFVEEPHDVPFTDKSLWDRIENFKPNDVCQANGCENKKGDKLTYCKSCVEKRKEFFKKRYYIKKGWPIK